MWKFVVTWIITVTVAIPCPDAEKADEFGIRTSYNSRCLVVHTKSQSATNRKAFFSRDSAKTFYNRGLANGNQKYVLGGKVTAIKLDSIPPKKKAAN